MKPYYHILILMIVVASLSHAGQIDSPRSIDYSGKTMSVTIKGVPARDQLKINGDYIIGANGGLRLPILKKQIPTKGLTLDQLSRKIEDSYHKAKIYRRCQITVKSRFPGCILISKVVAVGGFVKKPGRIPCSDKMTMKQAIDSAGGATAFGSIRRIELHRNGRKYLYDLKKPLHQKVWIYPGDAINVPQRHHG